MKLITKIVTACILFTLLACVSVSAGESVDSSPCVFCVDLIVDDDFCSGAKLFIHDGCIIDCDGKRFDLNLLYGSVDQRTDINIRQDLSSSGLNFKKPFKKVTLNFELSRHWGLFNFCDRYDFFTLDVTDLVLYPRSKRDCKFFVVPLQWYAHYKFGKACASGVCNANGNPLIQFKPTHEEGVYGRWDQGPVS